MTIFPTTPAQSQIINKLMQDESMKKRIKHVIVRRTQLEGEKCGLNTDEMNEIIQECYKEMVEALHP